MVRELFGSAEKFGWAMLTLAVMLAAMFFVLHLLATAAPSPISGLAGGLADRASGGNYGY